ncbi:unnamed protein product [Thlaspi arvense]|uniref:F-box domain-containing protein n=1 Tax=Thlaspi arvense TaxID=13288 RepID=A0AAU9SUA4_THLAR|nr:unnamed protein product [Thlaspi arvense]
MSGLYEPDPLAAKINPLMYFPLIISYIASYMPCSFWFGYGYMLSHGNMMKVKLSSQDPYFDKLAGAMVTRIEMEQPMAELGHSRSTLPLGLDGQAHLSNCGPCRPFQFNAYGVVREPTRERAKQRESRHKERDLARTKTTVSINPQTSKEDFDGIPEDLVFEIIGRLPAKSVARFLLVSKLWARIIRSKEFINSFPLGSSSQPRLLIAFGGLDSRVGSSGRGSRRWDPRKENWYFFSSALSSSSFFLSRSHTPLPCPENIEYHSHYVNGLLSVGYGQEQFIVDPTTGKCTALPRVKTRRKVAISFFGYDPLNDEYKLDLVSGVPAGNNLSYQVYGNYFLLNYEGNVAIPFKATVFSFDVWVLDQGAEKQEWLRILTFSIEPWMALFPNLFYNMLRVRGITRTGEFILVPWSYTCNGVYVFHYNPKTDSFRKIMVHVNAGSDSRLLGPEETVFSDYVESVSVRETVHA